jgi:hypothetical protein
MSEYIHTYKTMAKLFYGKKFLKSPSNLPVSHRGPFGTRQHFFCHLQGFESRPVPHKSTGNTQNIEQFVTSQMETQNWYM